MSSDTPEQEPSPPVSSFAGAPEAVATVPIVSNDASAPQGSQLGGAGTPSPQASYTSEDVRRMIAESENRQKKEFELHQEVVARLLLRLDHVPTINQLAWGFGLAALAVLGALFALVGIVGDRFDDGITVGSAIGERLEETRALNLENSRNFKRLLEKIEENESKNKQP